MLDPDKWDGQCNLFALCGSLRRKLRREKLERLLKGLADIQRYNNEIINCLNKIKIELTGITKETEKIQKESDKLIGSTTKLIEQNKDIVL